jgi:hypothetical protein
MIQKFGGTIAPKRSDFVLSTDIPDGEAAFAMFYSLHVET